MPPPRIRPQSKPDIFVDRLSHQREFDEAALTIPASGCALRVWHGVGGQGKSALARKLFHQATTDPGHAHIRAAMLNLHGRVKTDADRLMVWLRNELASAGVETAAFDLAFAIMWEKTRGDEPLPKFEKPWLMRSGEGLAEQAIPEAITLTRELIEQTAETIPGLGFLVKKGLSWSVEKSKKAWLTRSREHLQALYSDGQLLADHEMADLMPWMLAQDLNRHRAKNPAERFALFVDEYENVAAGAGTGRRWQDNVFDRHLRRFVAETDGLLVLFFSREPLHWAQDPDWRDDLAGNQFLLGGLPEPDARDWLASVPVTDPDVQAAIITGARDPASANAPVYPLLLELQVQHFHNLDHPSPDDFGVQAQDFAGRRVELVNRLLRDYGDAWQNVLQRLCLARRFDRAAFEHIITVFNIPLDFDAFDRIADLSLMTVGTDGWLTPHRAIADALVHAMPDAMRDPARSEMLVVFTKDLSNIELTEVDDDTVSRLQEAARLRLDQGLDGYVDWLQEHESKLYNAARIQPLAALWTEAVQLTEAEYGDRHADTATARHNLAIIRSHQGQYQDAEALLRHALDVRQHALEADDIQTAYSAGNLGLILHQMGRADQAETFVRQSLDIHIRVLGEGNLDTALCYCALGSVLIGQHRPRQALQQFEHALNIMQHSVDADHPYESNCYVQIVECLTRGGDPDSSDDKILARIRDLLDQALDIRMRWYGPDHPETVSINQTEGELLNQLEAYEQAEPLLRQVLDHQISLQGDMTPAIAYTKGALAVSLYGQGDHAGAGALLRDAIRIGEELLGTEHPETRRYRDNLETVLEKDC